MNGEPESWRFTASEIRIDTQNFCFNEERTHIPIMPFRDIFVDRALSLIGNRTRTTPVAGAAFVLMNEAGTVGAYVDRNGNLVTGQPGLKAGQQGSPATPLGTSVQNVYSASGAISVASQTAVITKTGSLAAMTLAAPVAGAPSAGGQDGTRIRITTTTAFAHTVTATTLVNDGATGVPHTTITFAAFAGASIELEAYNGLWNVISKNAATVS